MIVLALVIFLIIYRVSTEFYRPTKEQMFLCSFASFAVIAGLHFSSSDILTLSLVVLFTFIYSFIHKNPITNVLIYIKIMSYYLASLFIIVLTNILLGASTDWMFSYHLYSALILLMFLLDKKLNLTNALTVKAINYLELITSFLTVVIVILIAYSILIGDINSAESFMIISTNFMIIVKFNGDSMALAYYVDKCSFVHSLNQSLFEEYHNLVSEHYKNINSINTLKQYQSAELVEEYFNNHNVPVYSNDQQLNFMLYYILKNQDENPTFIDTSTLAGYNREINFLLFFISELLNAVPEVRGYSFTTSPIEPNSIIISVSGENGLNCNIQRIFTKFSLKKVKNINDIYKSHLNCKSLEFLLKRYKVSPSIIFDNDTMIKLSL